MMHNRSFLPALLAWSIAALTNAQDVAPTPEHYASQRAASYQRALGLDTKTTNKVAEVLAAGEAQVFDLRMELQALNERIERMLAAADEEAARKLSKEEQQRLRDLLSLGWTPSSDAPRTELVRHPPATGQPGDSPGGKPPVPPQPTPNATMH